MSDIINGIAGQNVGYAINNAKSSATEEPQTAAPVVNAQPIKEAAVQATGDSVEISTSARVKLLDQQGQSVSQIAAQLGLDLTTVKLYVG